MPSVVLKPLLSLYMANLGITAKLKSKNLIHNRSSYYIHYYDSSTQKRKREYLQLYFHTKARSRDERIHNREIKKLAESVFSKRTLEIRKGHFNIEVEYKSGLSLLEFIRQLIIQKEETSSKSNADNWNSMLSHLKRFTSKEIKLSEINEEFMNQFKSYLLNEVESRYGTPLKMNSASAYFNKFKASIHETFKRKLISDNPSLRIKRIKVEESKRE